MRDSNDRRRLSAITALGLLVSAVVVGCGSDPSARSQQVEGGNPQLGREALADYGCVSCHSVPGIDAPDSHVGPPLTAFGERVYIAGQLNNSQDNLVRWIMDPDEYAPGTAMPDLDVDEADALNMAAYLLSLD